MSAVDNGLGPVDGIKSMTPVCHVADMIFTMGQLFLLIQVVRKYFHLKHHKNILD